MEDEFDKLVAMLDEAKIPYDRVDSEWEFINIRRVHYPNNENCICSAINGYGTYGGQQGLIEIQGLLTESEAEYDDVVGYLTADDVFARIQADWEAKGE